MKKIFFFTLAFGLLLLLIVNYRTPFYRVQADGWSIGYGFAKDLKSREVIKNASIFSKENFRKIDTLSSFIADPFFIKEKDTFYLFFENEQDDDNAEISLLTSTNGRDYKYKGTVLDEKFHLSYPSVFKYKSEFYMLPETKQAGNILLYNTKNFPYNWKVKDTLVKNVRLKDPTVYLSDTLNLLFASDDKLQLHVFTAPSLFDNWKPLSKEIIKIGTEARPAGRIIKYKNELFLPLQNSTQGYGYAVSLHKIVYKNNEVSLEEAFPLFIKGQEKINPFSFGMHHVDFQEIDNKCYFVVDGNSVASRPKKLNLWGPLKWNFIDLKDWLIN